METQATCGNSWVPVRMRVTNGQVGTSHVHSLSRLTEEKVATWAETDFRKSLLIGDLQAASPSSEIEYLLSLSLNLIQLKIIDVSKGMLTTEVRTVPWTNNNEKKRTLEISLSLKLLLTKINKTYITLPVSKIPLNINKQLTWDFELWKKKTLRYIYINFELDYKLWISIILKLIQWITLYIWRYERIVRSCQEWNRDYK